MNDKQPLVGIGEAARQLGLSVSRLRRLASAGRVPADLTPGGHRRFDVRAVRTALGTASGANGGTLPPGSPSWERHVALAGLQEWDVWNDALTAQAVDRSASAFGILQYTFQELLNNAIEHSGGTAAFVRIWNGPEAGFEITDDGVGAFRRLKTDLGLASDIDAIAELTKGKATSDPAHHTGQGIFFSSKLLDVLRIESNQLAWTVDNLLDEQALGVSPVQLGTKVSARISASTIRDTTEVFQRYSDADLGFSKTRPRVQLLETGLAFVSRSEARMLMARLDQFEDVELDFGGVASVGQGFVDEVFRVWPAAHPSISITPVNMNPAVEFMIRRGLPKRP